MNSSRFFMYGNNTEHREKTNSSVLFDVRSFILTLVLTITMVMGSAFQAGSFVHADATVTEIDGVKVLKDGTKVYVATFKQLKAALSLGSNITEIIVDPQAAKPLTSVAVPTGQTGDVIYDAGSEFFIPIEEPLTVSGDITISSAEGVNAVFARAGKVGDGTYDSNAFIGQNADTPAFFNVDAGKKLTVNGNITMTGDVVTSDFNEGQEYVESVTVPVVLTDDLDGLYIADYQRSSVVLSDTPTGRTYLIQNGYLASKDGNGVIKYVDGGSANLPLRDNPGTLTIRAHDTDGNQVTKLEPGKSYALYDPSGNGRYLIKGNSTYYGGKYYYFFDFTDDVKKALTFTASGGSAPSGGGTSTSGQEYKPPSFTFSVESKEWAYGTDLASGGYFIHNARGGEVVLNNNVTLRGLNTNAPNNEMDIAPVYVAGGSKLTINGATISNNTVGYAAKEADSNGKSIQYIQKKLETTKMTNTAGGVILKGKGTEGTFTSGEISGNRADAGGVIVTGGAKVTMSDGFEIKNNVGYHHAGAAQVERGGIFIMNGGTMSGNVAWYKGGAVWATQWGTNGYADIDWSQWPKQFPKLKNGGDKGSDGVFVMNGANAKIENNTAFARGGAIEVESNGVVLEEGTIQKNNCRSLGGAIYVEGDAQSYSYTLVIKDGYIGDNRSVMHAKGSSGGDQAAKDNHTLNRYLNGGQLQNGGGDSWDNSFNGAMGNGGGVWLCPVGGSSVFASDTVNIDNNSAQRNKGGTDFYLHRGNGAMLVQNIAGSWVDENVLDENGKPKGVNFDDENGSVLNGPTSLRNDANPALTQSGKKIIIKENISRDGGGIAANGTLLFGPPKTVDRYDARITITKEWVGIDPKSVPNITFEIGFLDENEDFVSLKDTVTDKEGNETEVNYEFELDGKDDEASSSADESPANGGSAVGEVDAVDGKWKASAFIPAAVTLSNGKRYALYEFVNPEGGTLSPADIDDLPKIRKIIEDGGELKIAEGTWKLKIREKDANFKVTIRDIKVNNTATAAPYNDVPLYDPVTGTRTDGFRVYFSTVELDQDIKNEGKGIEFTKLASDTGRPLEGTEFYLTEAGTGKDWFVKGTRKDADGATLEGSVIEDLALHEDPLTPNAQGKVQLSTGMLKEGKELKPDEEYLLFETKAPEGYARKTSPWLVEIDNLGRVKITEVDPAQQGKYTGNGLTAVSGKTTESVFNTWWKKEWYTNSNAINTNLTLKNDWEPIEITKVRSSDNQGLGGAKFALYKIGGSGYLKIGDKIKDDITSTGSTGTVKLPITKPGIYWLFETDAPNGYIRAKSPWLVRVNADKTVKVIGLNSTNYGKYRNSSFSLITGTYNDGNDNLQNWITTNGPRWNKEWFNMDSSTVADDGNLVFLQDNANNAEGVVVSDNRISNSKANVVLTKINSKTNAAITTGTAEFLLFEANVSTTELFPNGTVNTENVVVQVKNKNNPIGGTNGIISTNANGKLNLNNLDVDKVYLLFERKAPTGYERSKTPWLIWVKKDGTHEIYKYAASKVKHGSNNTVYPLDHSGLIGWTNQFKELGSLKFPTKDTEVGTPTGTNGFNYVKQVNGNNNDDNLKNAPIEIEFEKLAEDSDLKLTTAKFDLYYATVDDSTVYASDNGKIYKVDKSKGTNGKAASNITISGGKYKISGIESNQIYLLFETDVPEGYADPVLPWGIYVDPDGNADMIDKTNYGFWRLKDEYTDKQIDAIKARFANATDKTEIYLECKEIERFDTYQLENKKKPIELYKVDETDDANRLGNAQFVICEAEIDQNSNYWIKNAKDSNGWIDGATVMSTAKKENGQTKVYTSSNAAATKGKIVIDDLEGSTSGKYYLLFEKTAPTGFVRSTSPWVIKVVDNDTGRTVVVKKIADTSNQGKVLVPGGNDSSDWEIVPNSTSVDNQTVKERWWADSWYQTYNNEPYNLVNEPKYLTKVDLSVVGDEGEGKGLVGAQFELFKAYRGQDTDDYFYRKEEDHPIDTYTTGADGKINLPSSVTTDNGWYLLFETAAPDGYKRTYTPWLLTVDNGNMTVQRFNGEKLKISYVHTVYGYQTIGGKTWWQHSHFLEETWNDKYRVPNVPNDVTLTKVDGYNASKKLKGAQFELFSYDRIEDDKYRYRVKESKGLTSISDENGNFTLPVTDGKYLMFEKQAPEGYVLSDKPWWLEITRTTDWYGITSVSVRVVPAEDSMPSGKWPDGNWDSVWWTFCADQTNGTVKNYPSIILTKLDLESVTKAYDSDGKETVSLNSDNPTIYLEGVKFKLFKATVSGSNPKTATWTKKNENSPVMVAGAEADGTIKTGKKGVLDLGDLANGNYILEETEALSGYNKPNHPWRLVVSNGSVKVYVPSLDGKPYIETDHNKYLTNVQTYDLPKTGGMGTYWFMVIGAMLMGFAVTAALTKMNLLKIFRR